MFDRFRSRNTVLSDEAIQWLIRLGDHPTSAERAAFEQWCQRSPAHGEAIRQARALLDAVGRTEAAAEHRHWVQALTPPRRSIGRRAFLVGGISAAAVAGFAGSGLFGPPGGFFADQSTRIGERRQLTLPDGSQAWLNTASALSVDFSDTSRQVSLAAGEALFDVVHEARQPFLVASRDGEIRASAGRYALRRASRHSALIVLSGTVEVRNAAGTAIATDNQRIGFSADVLGLTEAVDAAALTAWTRGKLVFNRQPLAEIAAELERYIASRVVVIGQRLRRLPLSGVFELDDPGALLRTIAWLARAEIVRLPLLTLIR